MFVLSMASVLRVFYSVFQVHLLFCFSVFQLLISVQLFSWKDASPKWPVKCRVAYKTLPTRLILATTAVKNSCNCDAADGGGDKVSRQICTAQ